MGEEADVGACLSPLRSLLFLQINHFQHFEGAPVQDLETQV